MKPSKIKSRFMCVQSTIGNYILMEWKDAELIGQVKFKQRSLLDTYLKENKIDGKCDHLNPNVT